MWNKKQKKTHNNKAAEKCIAKRREHHEKFNRNLQRSCRECSAYEKKCSCKGLSNDVTGKSCLNCDHFTDTEYCELDLYDPIVKNL